MNAFHEYRRRNRYRLCMIDEIHDQLGRATPFDGARIRASRKKYLLKLFKYKRRASGISLSRS